MRIVFCLLICESVLGAAQPVSEYMRQVGLTYLETIEDSFEQTERHNRALLDDKEPGPEIDYEKELHRMNDRIEMRVSTSADRAVWVLLMKTYTYSIVLGGDLLRDSGAHSGGRANLFALRPYQKHVADLYWICKDEVSAAIKSGTYYGEGRCSDSADVQAKAADRAYRKREQPYSNPER